MEYEQMWKQIQDRYDELSKFLASSDVESSQLHDLQEEFSYLTTLLEKYSETQRLDTKMKEVEKQLAETTDPEKKQLLEKELDDLLHQLLMCELSLHQEFIE